MPATTARAKIPYPLTGDRIADYPTTARAAAQAMETHLTPIQRALRHEPKWESFGGFGVMTSLGALHTVSLIVRWTPSAFWTETGKHFPILYVPEGVPTPEDWAALGTIHAGAYATPLVYRADTRSIDAFPTAKFAWPTGWCYGTATWIA